MDEQKTNNRIERQVELSAPASRVWRALTDHREFGAWFKVELEGPFVPGSLSRGHMTYPGYEHLPWEAVVQKMEPERLFSYTWHPGTRAQEGTVAQRAVAGVACCVALGFPAAYSWRAGVGFGA